MLVKKYFPFIDALEFVDVDESKISIMKKHKIDVWIDDSPTGILESYEAGIMPIAITNEETKYNWDVIAKHEFFTAGSVAELNIYSNKRGSMT